MEKLKLILTNPCSRDWDGLEVVSNGRYCDSCEKNVVDLTGKSDAELINFFKKKNENICGRLLANQLNRQLVPPPARTNWNWLLPLAVGAMFVSPSQAREFKPVAVQQNHHGFNAAPAVFNSDQSGKLEVDTIKGKVITDQGGLPLKGVKIRQKGFENVLAITDGMGQFELALTSQTSLPTLTFQFDGYALAELKPTNGMIVKLQGHVIRLGGVHVTSVGNEPMYYIYAGKKGCTVDEATFKQIRPEWIEKIDISKGASATALYGSKAANGAIIIEIKKTFAKKVDFSKKKIRD